MRMVPPSPWISAEAPLGKVSVVMIARAAAAIPSSSSAPARSPTIPAMRAAGSGSPMTPVELENTRFTGTPSAWATAPVTVSTAFCPCAPVKALALPEFTMIAAPVLLSGTPFSLAWQSRIEAARVEDFVNAPAMAVPGARRTSITSVRP